ncbi:MAG: MBL fold metallo-hydrolase [Clostridia bacterium]
MQIRKFVIGQFGTNCYILGDKKVTLIDPGANAEGIINYLNKENMILEKILVTHGHFDHVAALKELREKTNAKVYMHKDDICMLGDMEKSLGFMAKVTPEKCEIDVVLSGGEKIEVGDEVLEVLHTPGHSQGSVSYMGKDIVFSGDLIFRGSIGRYDYGDYNTEIQSIEKLLSKLSDTATIFPGHGEETTAIWEKENNIFLR